MVQTTKTNAWPTGADLRVFYILYFALAAALVILPLIIPDAMYAFYTALFAPILIAIWLVTALYFSAAFVVLVGRKAWQQSAAVALLAAFVAITAAGWPETYQSAADWEHFIAMRPHYDAVIARLPDTGARFAEFNWGGFSFGSRGIVYDETDEIGRSPGQQSKKWISRMKETDLLCGENNLTVTVRRLAGHYYATSFGC